MHLSQLPLVKSDSDVGPAELAAFARYGWKAINYQTQNDHVIRDFDLAPARAAGLSPGVWGVSYRRVDFFRDGKALAQSALRLGAEHVTMDVEMALKGTRHDRGAQPIIDGIRAGGWHGPVHLNTLGGPVWPRTADNPTGNDYEFDYASFLETGGGVFLQSYFNMADEYRPKPSVDHALYSGVPADRINVTISLAHSEPWAPKPSLRIDGAGWVPLLREAGVTKNLSIFLARSVMGDIDGSGPDQGDLAELAVLTLAAEPTPEPVPVEEIMDQLRLANTGVNAVLDRVELLFDRQVDPETGVQDPAFADPDGVDALRKYLLALGAKVNELVDAVNQLRA